MTLYSISTYELVRRLSQSRDLLDLFRAEALVKNGIKNYGQLEEAVNEGEYIFGEYIFDDPFFRDVIREAKIQLIKNSRRKDCYPSLYYFSNYEEAPVSKRFLEHSDSITPSSVLPLRAPYTFMPSTDYRLKGYTIYELKHLLSHYSLSGKIALIASTYNVGDYKVKRIVGCLKLYDEQILRIVREEDVSNYEGALFFKDAESKQSIVSDNLSSMASVLMTAGREYVWGTPTDGQKEALLNRVVAPRLKKDFIVRDRLISYFADYATLSELQSKESREEVVKRFILK
ncbi:MAG TPA: hypothetical protein DCY94_00010 [Firmicutes bacterium]|nr:hypothetical protein [Bacillota bacterium]